MSKLEIDKFVTKIQWEYDRQMHRGHNRTQWEEEVVEFKKNILVDFHWDSWFPQYVEHDINSEIGVTRFFSIKTENVHYQSIEQRRQYMLEDVIDFDYYWNQQIELADNFYQLLINCYTALYTLSRFRRECISFLSQPRLRFDTEIHRDQYLQHKRGQLSNRIECCEALIKKFYNKVQEEKYIAYLVWKTELKSTIDYCGSIVWKRKTKKIQDCVVHNSGSRKLWCFNEVAEVIIHYLVGEHPNDIIEHVSKKTKLIDNDD